MAAEEEGALANVPYLLLESNGCGEPHGILHQGFLQIVESVNGDCDPLPGFDHETKMVCFPCPQQDVSGGPNSEGVSLLYHNCPPLQNAAHAPFPTDLSCDS